MWQTCSSSEARGVSHSGRAAWFSCMSAGKFVSTSIGEPSTGAILGISVLR